jgi:ribonuclease P protein component
MLASKYRFHGHGGLRYLYKNSHTARSRHFMLRYVANKTRDNSRMTVIIGKKVYKSAAKRNRIRRRVYEIIRHNWAGLEQGYDIAITAYSPELLLLPHDELTTEIKQLLSQIPPYKSRGGHGTIGETEN